LLFHVGEINKSMVAALARCIQLQGLPIVVATRIIRTLLLRVVDADASAGSASANVRTGAVPLTMACLFSTAVGYTAQFLSSSDANTSTSTSTSSDADADANMDAATAIGAGTICASSVPLALMNSASGKPNHVALGVASTPAAVRAFWQRRAAVWQCLRECVLRMPWGMHSLSIWEDLIATIAAVAAPPLDALVGIVSMAAAVTEIGGEVPTATAATLLSMMTKIGLRSFEMQAGDLEGGAWNEALGIAMRPCVQVATYRPDLLIRLVESVEQAIATTGVGKSATSVTALTNFVGYLVRQPVLRSVWKGHAASASPALLSLRAAVSSAGVATEQFDSEVTMLRL
jgi:hypothetical protein